MRSSPKTLLALAIFAGAIFIVFTIIRFGEIFVSHPVTVSSSTPISGGEIPPGGQVPSSAFLPQGSDNSARLLQNQIQNQVSPSVIAEAKRLTLPEIQKKVEDALPPPARPQDLLALPVIADSELTIDPSGIKTQEEYLKYFATHIKDISFNNNRFASGTKDANNLVMLPADLVQRVIGGETSSTLQYSLKTFRDLSLAKVDYFKTLKVAPAMVAMNKRMIGFEMLHAQLLDKAIAVAGGTETRDNLKTFYDKFKTTALQENAGFLNSFSIVSAKKGFFAGFLENTLSFLGLRKQASAQLPTLIGGVVTVMVPCTCILAGPQALGLAFTVAGPDPVTLMASYIWIATPALFPYKGVHPGAWWLGEYTPAPAPCLLLSVCGWAPCCIPNPIIAGGATPFLVGTSQ